MKKLIFSDLLIFIAPFLIISCSTDYTDGNFKRDTDSGWVQFASDSSAAVAGNNAQIAIDLQTITNDEALSITYSVEAVEGDVPQSILGTFTQDNAVNRGENLGIISIPTETVNNDQCYSIKITILDFLNTDEKASQNVLEK